MMGQDKTQEKQLNEVTISKLPEEIIENNDNEDDPWSQKRNREDARDVCQRTIEELKKKEGGSKMADE